jgi:hypothetical protein
MALNGCELSFCRHVIQDLLKCPLCYEFAKPIDPKAERAPDYLRLITCPVDLSTILSGLNSNRDHSVTEWYNDLNLIWQNAMTFNPRQSRLYSIADFLQKKV